MQEIRCSNCGTPVSKPVISENEYVRAGISCPECIKKEFFVDEYDAVIGIHKCAYKIRGYKWFLPKFIRGEKYDKMDHRIFQYRVIWFGWVFTMFFPKEMNDEA